MYNKTPEGYAEELLDGITDTLHEGFLFDEMSSPDQEKIKKVAVINVESILQAISPSTFLPDKWTFFKEVEKEIKQD
jgi:hypothetical protein